MYIAVDPEGALHVATQTDDALAELAANFKVCDRAAEAVASVLDAEAPGVAASMRDVAAREGGDQVKICTAARATTVSLRQAVGDFTRQAEKLRDEIADMTEAVEQAVEHGVDRFQQGVAEVEHLGEQVARQAHDIAEMMTGSSKTPRKLDR